MLPEPGRTDEARGCLDRARSLALRERDDFAMDDPAPFLAEAEALLGTGP
jgi:hypothetical protein